jgi:hypothetical protein
MYQPLLPAVHDSVPGVMFSAKTVFILSETTCIEDQACRFAPTTVHILQKHHQLQCFLIIEYLLCQPIA